MAQSQDTPTRRDLAPQNDATAVSPFELMATKSEQEGGPDRKRGIWNGRARIAGFRQERRVDRVARESQAAKSGSDSRPAARRKIAPHPPWRVAQSRLTPAPASIRDPASIREEGTCGAVFLPYHYMPCYAKPRTGIVAPSAQRDRGFLSDSG
jgi:hypothetical protein